MCFILESAFQFFQCPYSVSGGISTTNSVRHRPSHTQGQINCFVGVVNILNPVVEKRDTQEQEREGEEEEEEEVTTSAIVRVVIKGVGSIMLLSLILWLVFLFIYKPPSSAGRLVCM